MKEGKWAKYIRPVTWLITSLAFTVCTVLALLGNDVAYKMLEKVTTLYTFVVSFYMLERGAGKVVEKMKNENSNSDKI